MPFTERCWGCGEEIKGTTYSRNGGLYCYNCFWDREEQQSECQNCGDDVTLNYGEGDDMLCRDCAHMAAMMRALPIPPNERGKVKSDGGSTSYYEIPQDATELRHLISHKGMSFARGNIFKALYRLGEKEGTDVLYDLNKIKFFAEELIAMYHKGEKL